MIELKLGISDILFIIKSNIDKEPWSKKKKKAKKYILKILPALILILPILALKKTGLVWNRK